MKFLLLAILLPCVLVQVIEGCPGVPAAPECNDKEHLCVMHSDPEGCPMPSACYPAPGKYLLSKTIS